MIDGVRGAGRIYWGVKTITSTPRWLLRASFASLLLASVGGLASCGFRPMYAHDDNTSSPLDEQLSQVQVGVISGRSGQLLRNELTRMLGDNSDQGQHYSLSVRLEDNQDTFALERSGFATRANVELIASYHLIDESTGTQMMVGNARAVSGYNLLDNDFSTYVSSQDARSRAANQLAAEIRNRLASYFSTKKSGSL